MPDLTILITQAASLALPTTLVGWFGWIVFLVAIVLLNLKWRSFNHQQDPWHNRALIILLICVPITTLFLPSIKLHAGGIDLFLPLFGAVPFILAAGFLGPGFASGIALLTGLIISIWGGMNIFLPLDMALVATCLGWAFFQDYRTPFYQSLRHPFVSSILVLIIYPLIYIISMLFLSQGSIGMRLIFGVEQSITIWIMFGTFFLVAGIIGELFAFLVKSKWGSQGAKRPSPAERKLSARFMISVVPLSIFLIAVLIISTWSIAGRAARQMLEGRMATAAQMTAQSIPFYLETGQNLLLQLGESTHL